MKIFFAFVCKNVAYIFAIDPILWNEVGVNQSAEVFCRCHVINECSFIAAFLRDIYFQCSSVFEVLLVCLDLCV